jgi:hypothetical protein
MSNREINELTRKRYKLEDDLLRINKHVSKTRSDLEKANRIENQIIEINRRIDDLQS